jgi:hypothetical protein
MTPVEIKKDLNFITEFYSSLIKNIPSFEVASKADLPYGLKKNTRSISWIAEQVITQRAKKLCRSFGVDSVEFASEDTSLHNSVLCVGEKQYLINIKIRDVEKKVNSSDIASVKKIYEHYSKNPNYNLIYVCFGFKFKSRSIEFDPDYLIVFSPQFLPLNINTSINKLQARYNHDPVYRTRAEFIELLKSKLPTLS